jgi:hypothetical protein
LAVPAGNRAKKGNRLDRRLPQKPRVESCWQVLRCDDDARPQRPPSPGSGAANPADLDLADLTSLQLRSVELEPQFQAPVLAVLILGVEVGTVAGFR